MPRVTFMQSLLNNLKGTNEPEKRSYLPREEAYELLKYHTGQDFGQNIDMWEQWLREHPSSIHEKEITSTPLSNFLKNISEERGEKKY